MSTAPDDKGETATPPMRCDRCGEVWDRDAGGWWYHTCGPDRVQVAIRRELTAIRQLLERHLVGGG